MKFIRNLHAVGFRTRALHGGGDMCSHPSIHAPCGIPTAHITSPPEGICAAATQYMLPAVSSLRISPHHPRGYVQLPPNICFQWHLRCTYPRQGCRIYTESQPPISFGNIADNHLIFFCRLTKCQPFLFGMSFDLSGTVVLAEAAAPLPCCLPDSG